MVILLVVGFLIICLGFFVLLKNYKSAIHIIFFCLALTLAFWVISSTSTDLSNNEEIALIWARLAIVGPFVFATFFSFIFLLLSS